MILDVAELRALGQVYRRVDELDTDVDTWRAGMRRAARREGMRIRTFLVVQTHHEHAADEQVDHARADGWSAPPSALVCAVRTDVPPPTRGELAEIVNSLPAPPGYGPGEQPPSPVATVTSLTDQLARRSGHPCAPDEH